MFLSESPLFDSLSQFLGIPSAALEGGAVTLLAVAILALLRILMAKEREDEKQLSLSTQIVGLLAKSLEGFEALKGAIEANSAVLTTVKEAFEGVVGNQVTPLKDELRQVRNELWWNNRTKVVIKDATGKIIAEVIAEPVTEENGEQHLVVTYDNTQKAEEDSSVA